MSDQPIVILTASAGAGHNIAARAIHDALSLLAPAQPVVLHDVLDFCPTAFRVVYSRGYAELISRTPRLFGWLYETMDKPGRGPSEWLRLAIQASSTGGVGRRLRRISPRLIIHTHFLPAEIVAGLRRRGRLDCPQWTVLTDFEAFRLWIQPPTDRYYASTTNAADYLRAAGVPHDAIRVSGIPIRPAFWDPAERMEMRARHGLIGDRPVLLVSCGRSGRQPERMARALTGVRSDAQIVLISGRDERLRARLERGFGRQAPRFRVLGHTDRMHEWMRAADLLVSKPGGLTSSEALACGLPLVIVDPIPGQETRNSDYLLERGAGVKVNDLKLLSARVNRLLSDTPALAEMREAAGRAARPYAAREIAQDALAWLGFRSAARPPAVPALT